MLIILTIAFLATIGFYKQASLIGVHPGKAASVPFIAAGLMIAFGKLAAMGISRFIAERSVSAELTSWLQFAISGCVVLTYAWFIRRNWKTLMSYSKDSESAVRLETDGTQEVRTTEVQLDLNPYSPPFTGLMKSSKNDQ